MAIEINTHLLTFNKWTLRFRPATEPPARVLLMLHGWTGDENSMWAFTSNFPSNYWMLAPRAPYPANEGGYSWRELKPGTWGTSTLADLSPSAHALIKLLDDWALTVAVDIARFDMIGFSQGAALANTIALLYPGRVHKVGVLAGFVPTGADDLVQPRPLDNKPIFVAHGTLDDLVPLERARQSIALLEQAGAEISYCQSEVGHKVSADCLISLENFFKD